MLTSLLARVGVRPRRDEGSRGDRPPSPHAGLKIVALDSYRDWQIEVARSQGGVFPRQDRYSALIQPAKAGREECFAGFATPQAALAAARKRIDLHSLSPLLRWHEPHDLLRKRHGR